VLASKSIFAKSMRWRLTQSLAVMLVWCSLVPMAQVVAQTGAKPSRNSATGTRAKRLRAVRSSPKSDPASGQIVGAGSFTDLVYEQDCNDPDGPLPTSVCRDVRQSLLPPGYPYYVGHDEPETEYFSNTPGSGNNIRWKIRLPQKDPTPTQNGTVVANIELYPTFWISLALCDPASTPFNPCTPNSDSNTSGLSNPSAAGSAILELQFYPPGSQCPGDDSKWCASMTIDELTTNCGEPITAAPITTNGLPAGPRLLMSPGDSILITIKDTANGLENDVVDVTSSASGSMIASVANGFVQTLETTHLPLMPVPAGTCSTTPFAYHPEYSTASQANTGSWIFANVNLAFEIGHWELCGDAACKMLPDSDADDTGCGTALGVGGCTGKDSDHNGTSYQTDWPDGSASHPSSLIMGNALNNGIGPLSFSGGSYQAPYGKIFFQPATIAGAFYPFFSQAGTGSSCVLNFGNDIPGTTTNDFGKTAQYGQTIPNPCAGAAPSISKSFGAATVPLAQTTSLSFVITNPNATLPLTGVNFSDSLPAGLVQTGSVNGVGCGAFSVAGLPNSINVSNIAIAAAGTCTITATVTGASAGVKSNLTSNVTANESSSPGNTALATVTVVAPPMLVKSFAAPTVPLNQNVNLSFKVTNPNTTVALTGVGFTDNLPSGLQAIGPVTAVGCPAAEMTFTASTITATGITLPSLGSCTFTLAVKGTIAGAQNNTTGNITSVEGGSGAPASASITVVAPPSIVKSFGALAIPVGASTSLSFTIANPNSGTALTGVGFTDTLPSGLLVAAPNGLAGSCGGGAITATPGSPTVSLAGATIAAGSTCTFSVLVTGTEDGAKNNLVTVNSTNGGTGNTAPASIVVGDAFSVNYAANLSVGDSFVDFTNTGSDVANGSSQNICVNLYAFDPSEELIGCCACTVTPNALQSLSVLQSVIAKPLTPAIPASIVIKAVATVGAACNPSVVTAASLASGLKAWRSTLHQNTSIATPSYSPTETRFLGATLVDSELTHITSTCGFIQSNGSGFGICNGCAAGGLGSSPANQ
jgi:hypothetical protein